MEITNQDKLLEAINLIKQVSIKDEPDNLEIKFINIEYVSLRIWKNRYNKKPISDLEFSLKKEIFKTNTFYKLNIIQCVEESRAKKISKYYKNNSLQDISDVKFKRQEEYKKETTYENIKLDKNITPKKDYKKNPIYIRAIQEEERREEKNKLKEIYDLINIVKLKYFNKPYKGSTHLLSSLIPNFNLDKKTYLEFLEHTASNHLKSKDAKFNQGSNFTDIFINRQKIFTEYLGYWKIVEDKAKFLRSIGKEISIENLIKETKFKRYYFSHTMKEETKLLIEKYKL